MRPLKLHTKASVISAAVTIGMLTAALLITSASIANLEREDDKALAQLQAVNLAAQLSNLPQPQDPQGVARAVNLVMGARPNFVSVRIWERSGGEFVERVAASGSAAAETIPEDTKEALRSGLASKVVAMRPYVADQSLFRVFVPITNEGRLSGAVEVDERFDSIGSVVLRYARKALWMSLLAIILITLGNYLLFRYLVYQPIGYLRAAMARAKAGDLQANVPLRAADELGLLSNEFNSMIRQVRDMTAEREALQLVLEQRVLEATAALANRNKQLNDANLELWHTTQRMNKLRSLAAAGQVAAQFAHEVGTPLNLISGHVQLLRGDLGHNPHESEARLNIIGEQIERIERIVRGMLDRTRVETELISVDLNQILKNLFVATAVTLDKRNVTVVESLNPNIPQISGSSDRLQQLFLNLINNALDAMPNGGTLTVSTAVQVDNSEMVTVDFADDGCGMESAILAHIFDPLYTNKAPGQGSGLGLVIVNQIVREHGGEIEVESKPGRGTRFRLTFHASKRTHVVVDVSRIEPKASTDYEVKAP